MTIAITPGSRLLSRGGLTSRSTIGSAIGSARRAGTGTSGGRRLDPTWPVSTRIAARSKARSAACEKLVGSGGGLLGSRRDAARADIEITDRGERRTFIGARRSRRRPRRRRASPRRLLREIRRRVADRGARQRRVVVGIVEVGDARRRDDRLASPRIEGGSPPRSRSFGAGRWSTWVTPVCSVVRSLSSASSRPLDLVPRCFAIAASARRSMLGRVGVTVTDELPSDANCADPRSHRRCSRRSATGRPRAQRLVALGELPVIVFDRLEQVVEKIGRALIPTLRIGVEGALDESLDRRRHAQRARWNLARQHREQHGPDRKHVDAGQRILPDHRISGRDVTGEPAPQRAESAPCATAVVLRGILKSPSRIRAIFV